VLIVVTTIVTESINGILVTKFHVGVSHKGIKREAMRNSVWISIPYTEINIQVFPKMLQSAKCFIMFLTKKFNIYGDILWVGYACYISNACLHL
jgi:hypothetical protein